VLKQKLGYDDSLDAFGIHGIGGTWGSIATGIWATTAVNPDGANGLFYGETNLFFAQIISTIVAYALGIVGSYVLYKLVDHFISMRVDEAEEIAGLDLVEHGEQGYSGETIGGSPILGALENSSELLARTVMASGHSALK
jgi:Amt family ammonium transporter